MGCVNFSWMILWLIVRTAFALDQEQVIVGKLDPKWSQYIADIAGDYSEHLAPATEPEKRQQATPKKGWDTAGDGETPYLAVIYSQQAHNHLNTLDFYKAGAACGAALITEDKVLTLCACVASWWMYYYKNVWDVNGRTYKFSKFNIKSKYLQVAHSKHDFAPTSHTSELVGNKTAISLQPKCTNYIEQKGNPIEQQVTVVIIQLKSVIKYPFAGQYIPWPPAPILHDGPRDSEAEVITFGMKSKDLPPRRFYGYYGDEIKLNITAVNFKLKKVNFEDCANEFGQLRQEIQERSTCFHPAHVPMHELCGGLVGSPVVIGSNIQGLLATSINCRLDKGAALVLDFVKPVKELIENFTGSAFLNKQNNLRPRLWRDDDLPKGYVAYEEGIIPPLQSHRSTGVIWFPTPFVIGLAYHSHLIIDLSSSKCLLLRYCLFLKELI